MALPHSNRNNTLRCKGLPQISFTLSGQDGFISALCKEDRMKEEMVSRANRSLEFHILDAQEQRCLSGVPLHTHHQDIGSLRH